MKKLKLKKFNWPKQHYANILFFVAVILAFAYIAIPRADGTLFGSYNMRMRPLSAPQVPTD